MTVEKLAEVLHSLVCGYFQGASVVWANTKKVKPLNPLVTMRLGPVSRSIHPNTKIIDGELCGYYPSSTMLEVQLFTPGRRVQAGEQTVFVNTAVNDLFQFVNFLESSMAQDRLNREMVSIRLEGDVQDFTGLVNDTGWEYRAMAEFAVDFVMIAAGYSGTLLESSIEKPSEPESGSFIPKWELTPSGGGLPEGTAKQKTGFFTEAEVNEEEKS